MTAVVDRPAFAARRIAPRALLVALAALVVALAGASLATGSVALGPRVVVAALLAPLHGVLGIDVGPVDPLASTVLWTLRLPRTLLAAVAGAGLGLAGATLQAIFRNPLADPALIGVSSGAAVAVAATIVFGAALPPALLAATGPVTLPLAGFAGGLAVASLLYRLATRDGRTSLTTMLLAGVAINALAYAAIGLATTLATGEQLRSIAFWSFGSVAGVPVGLVVAIAVPMALAGAWLMRLAPAFDALVLGDREARHLGFEPERVKRVALALSALLAGAVVAACGVIAFVALVAPHAVRLVAGPHHRIVMPGAALAGAALLLAADLVARTVATPVEVPIGIVTALIGAPCFLWLLLASDRHDLRGDA